MSRVGFFGFVRSGVMRVFRYARYRFEIMVGLGRGGAGMLKVKDTLRSTVHLSFDGRVVKVYHGLDARARFENEVRVLRLLEERGCGFVPRLLEADSEAMRIVTTNCGTRVDHLDEKRRVELFAELEGFGVRHEDADVRNVTYRMSDGRFCVIDFEFATVLGEGLKGEARG
jgi:predicted Ser/Thr protein kinase